MCLICVDTKNSRYVSFGHSIIERRALDSREYARCSVMIFSFNYTRLLLSITGNRCWFIQVDETCPKFREFCNFEFYEGNKSNQNVIQPILGFTFIFIRFINYSYRIISGFNIGVAQGCTNPKNQVEVVTTFCTVEPHVCKLSVRNWLYVTFLPSRLLKWLLDFWIICAQ